MAEAHQTLVSVTDEAPVYGPSSNPGQNDYDALKQELADMKTTLQSLIKTIEDMRERKVEAVSCVCSWPFALSPPPPLQFASVYGELHVNLSKITREFGERVPSRSSRTDRC